MNSCFRSWQAEKKLLNSKMCSFIHPSTFSGRAPWLFHIWTCDYCAINTICYFTLILTSHLFMFISGKPFITSRKRVIKTSILSTIMALHILFISPLHFKFPPGKSIPHYLQTIFNACKYIHFNVPLTAILIIKNWKQSKFCHKVGA